jgi:hypothetical protein
VRRFFYFLGKDLESLEYAFLRMMDMLILELYSEYKNFGNFLVIPPTPPPPSAENKHHVLYCVVIVPRIIRCRWAVFYRNGWYETV